MNATPQRQLTLLDSVCLIVGIIVGAGIYQAAPDIAKGVSNGYGLLAVWLVGGVLSLLGALGYAELASAYPQQGGDYAYLTRAYGPWAGFLFGWIQLVIVRPGDIAVMAFAFATYARTLYEPSGEVGRYVQQLYACSAVAVLTLVNIIGVRQGKWTQNILTFAKVAGLVAIVGVALFSTRTSAPITQPQSLPLSLAVILVLFTFGGWNEMAYVAAEVVNPRRNIVRALVLGTTAVTALYLLVNVAFLYALGYAGLNTSHAVAVDTIATVFPRQASLLISLLVCLSALGAVNGLIFAGARISYAVGCDHSLFRPLGQWDARTGTPVRSLLLQGLIAIGLIVVLGSFINTLLYTAAPVYLFYLASSVAVIVLRRKDLQTERPYRVWAYPLTPLIFSATCAFLAYSAVVYKPWVALSALALLLLGLPLYLVSNRVGPRPPSAAAAAGQTRTESHLT